MSERKIVARVTVVESTGIRLPSEFDQKVARIVATRICHNGGRPRPEEIEVRHSDPLSLINDPAPDTLGIAIFAPRFKASACQLASIGDQIAAVIMNDCFRGKQKIKVKFLTEAEMFAAKRQAA